MCRDSSPAVFISERSADRVATRYATSPDVFRCSLATQYKRGALQGYTITVHPFQGHAHTMTNSELEGMNA